MVVLAAHREDLVADPERDVDLPREALLGLRQRQRDPADVVERAHGLRQRLEHHPVEVAVAQRVVQPDRALVRLADREDHPLDPVVGGPPLEVLDQRLPDAVTAPALDDRHAELRGRHGPGHVAGRWRVRDVDGRGADHDVADHRRDVLAGLAAALDPAPEADGDRVAIRDVEDLGIDRRVVAGRVEVDVDQDLEIVERDRPDLDGRRARLTPGCQSAPAAAAPRSRRRSTSTP